MAASFSSDGHTTTLCENQDLAPAEQPSLHSARRPTYLEILKATLPLSPAFNGIGNKAARDASKSSHQGPLGSSDDAAPSASKPTPERPIEVPTEPVSTESETRLEIDICPHTLDASDLRSDTSDAAILKEIVETISSTSGVEISDTAQPEFMAHCTVCGVIGSVDSEGNLCCGRSACIISPTNLGNESKTELHHSGQELPSCNFEVGDLANKPKPPRSNSQPTYLEILKAARPFATTVPALSACCTNEDMQYDVASAVDTDQIHAPHPTAWGEAVEAPTKLGVKRQVGCSILAFDAIEVGSTVASGSSSASEALPIATAALDFPSFAGATPSEASSSQAVSSTAEAGVVEGMDMVAQDESDGMLPEGHRAVTWAEADADGAEADADGAEGVPPDQDESDEVTPEESPQASSSKRSRHRRRRTNKNRRSANKNGVVNGTESAMATTALLLGDTMMPVLGGVSSPAGRHVVTWGDLGSDLLLGPMGGNGSVAEAAPPLAVCSPTVTAWSSLVRRATARGGGLGSDTWTGQSCVGSGHVAIATLAPATTAMETSGQSATVGQSDAMRSWLRFARGLPSCEDLAQQLRAAAPEACANLAEQLRAYAPDTYED